jgi:ABC-type sugar transport system permease subunit
MKKNRIPAAFVLPAGLIYTVLLVIPILMALAMSFTKWNGVGQATFIGLKNYRLMLADTRLGNAAANTGIITCVVVVFDNVLGLLLAVLLNKTGARTSFFRTIFFVPFVLSSVAISFVWKSILSYTGVLNAVLTALGLSGWVGDFLGSRGSALVSICSVEIWRTLGFHMVLYLAALQTVPAELYEACTVDGGGAWAKFRSITLPMIVPGATVSVLMSVINELRIYDIVKIMTDGGPGYDTETIVYNIVSKGFSNNLMGYSSAIAVVLFLVIGGISVFIVNRGARMGANT